MRTYKKIIGFVFLAFVLNACSEDDKTEYPGSLIKHGAVNIVMPGSDINDPNMRMFAFSGAEDTDLSALPSGDWTYELWIKVDPEALIGNKDARNGLYAGGAAIGDRRHNFELYLINDFFGDEADFAIKYGKLHASDDNATQLASMQSDESSVSLHFDEWIHVAISRSSSDGIARFYINGTLIDSSTDDVWKQTNSDEDLDFNYLYRGTPMHFFKGGMDNIRLSTINRYPDEFTPDRLEGYQVDEYTLLQLNLDNKLSPTEPESDFDKISILGTYTESGYYIKVHKDNTWFQEPNEYFPLGDY